MRVFKHILIHVAARRALIAGLGVLCLTPGVFARQVTKGGNPEAAKITNPVEATPDSIAAGKKTYFGFCGGCHGADAKGGLVLSIVEDRGGSPPPDLTDDKSDYGSSDGEVFTVVKKGVPPEFIMGSFEGRLSDTDIWNVINYVRSLSPKKQ